MAIVRTQTRRPVPTRAWDSGLFGNGMLGEIDRFLSEVAAPGTVQAAPHYPIDLYETGDALVLEMAVPGVQANDLDISIEGRQLSIRGQLPQGSDEARRYWVQGIPRGEFSRTVTLPTPVVVDEVRARAANGLLTLTMPKVAQAQVRKIAIDSD